MAKSKTEELGLTGKGVAPLKIKELDKLADVYMTLRDARIEALREEIEAKGALLASLHKNEDKIKQPDGTLMYHFDESVITLSAGKEKLKVQPLSFEEDEEAQRE